jgi:AMP-polyphosphate phosphotransferase
MFEAAEVGSTVSKDEFEKASPQLRVDLINAQYDLQNAGFSVIVLIAGDDSQGCDELVDLLHAWMDVRYLDTQFFGTPTDEEAQRPRFWRYWRRLPPKGRIGIGLRAWTMQAITARATGEVDDQEYDLRLDHIERFEEALAEDGTLVLKFWVHLPRAELRRRLKHAKKHPESGWQMTNTDRAIYRNYEQVMEHVERALRRTSTAHAQWNIIEGTDRRYRDLALTTTLRDALSTHIAQARPTEQDEGGDDRVPATMGAGALAAVDLTKSIPHPEYKKKLTKLQDRIHRLGIAAREQGQSSVLLFEGWDAAGKGGVIRRITTALSAQDYHAVPIAAPTDEELAHHYLWRFWRHLPRVGQMVIFDRSWYGRVLVERVEDLTPAHAWRRAYAEINDFEEQIVERGIPVLKFWLHIDQDEQLRRFQAREKTPYKKYKITDEDYRNRDKWDAYVDAVNEMVERTSTSVAPWHLLAANDKRWARLAALKVISGTLADLVDRD